MKHVIVVETPDDQYISSDMEDELKNGIEAFMPCQTFIQSSFNQSSAIAAVHEMYNAPKWEGGL